MPFITQGAIGSEEAIFLFDVVFIVQDAVMGKTKNPIMDQNEIVLLVLCKLSESNLSVLAPFLFILCCNHVGSTGGLDGIE